MHRPPSPFSTPHILRDLLRVLLYNSGIALFLTAITSYDLWTNLIYAQAIGCSIALCFSLFSYLRGQDKPDLRTALIAIPLGAISGFILGTWGNRRSLVEVFQLHPQAVILALATALVFGVIASYFFVSQARIDAALAEADNERLRRLEQEALASQAELRLLQAQIEPHFLFNTLSVVIELIASQPASARSMLLNLVTLLRASMANTHRESIPLGQELALVRAYLDIMAIRMGPRLRYRIEADAQLHNVPLPPLLLQPLVENALRHGLEPKAEGGSIAICCRQVDHKLVLLVEDSGRGLAADAGTSGVGLSNIRQRLRNRYGDAASFSLSSTGDGVIARAELPYSGA